MQRSPREILVAAGSPAHQGRSDQEITEEFRWLADFQRAILQGLHSTEHRRGSVDMLLQNPLVLKATLLDWRFKKLTWRTNGRPCRQPADRDLQEAKAALVAEAVNIARGVLILIACTVPLLLALTLGISEPLVSCLPTSCFGIWLVKLS